MSSVMHNNRKEHLYKILVIGDLGVGKTSIIKRYVHQTYSTNYRATIGVDFALKVLNWDTETVRLQLWDIAVPCKYIYIYMNLIYKCNKFIPQLKVSGELQD
uniref:RAB38b, member of RAS oncogene family n=1 Tax=Sinocyclocheilus grahami TaxID=75366 RepID=A0A672RE01_SINGR